MVIELLYRYMITYILIYIYIDDIIYYYIICFHATVIKLASLRARSSG